MSAQLTITDIERLLRTRAPDEPANLPVLVLPGRGPERVAFRVSPRSRRSAGEARHLRLVVAVVALLAMLAAILGAGALRLLDRADPLADACLYVPDQPYDPSCLPVAVPDGWTVLGAGQIYPGDFTEDGLGYEHVRLVMANAPLGGCPSPGGPFPTGRPVGTNAFEQPYPTPDAGLWCLRAAPLPENGVRIEAMQGQRISGLAEDGYGIPDTSEPTEAAGWDQVVAGRPARLTVTSSTTGRPGETRTWDILFPGSIDQVLRIRADIAGPDVEAGRAAAQGVIDSTRFQAEAPALDETAANEVLASLLDDLDRDGRAARTDYFGCFPRQPGTAGGTVSGGPSAPLGRPLEVTCTSAIEASRAGVWRVTLEVTWPAAEGRAGDTIRTEYFTTGVAPDPSSGLPGLSGGYMTSLSGRPLPREGPEAWFPTASYVLPPLLTEPLNLPAGSIVEILWPGEAPAEAPGAADGSSYPGIVGSHAYVIAGPTIVDGEEWYQVQGGEPGADDRVGWLRGTRDGRPQLALIAPACPGTAAGTVDEVTWLIPAERVACFGNRELTLVGTLVAADRSDMDSCDGEFVPPDCSSFAGEPTWLAGYDAWQLYGPAGPTGPVPGLSVWLAPSIAAPQGDGNLRLTGHFDDAAARGCRLAFVAIGPYAPDPVLDELLCRQRFVVTSIEPAG